MSKTYNAGDIVEISRSNLRREGMNRIITNHWDIGQVVSVKPYDFSGELHCEVHGVFKGKPMLVIVNCKSRAIRHLGEDTPHPEVQE
jgi:hypothetical protein